MASYSVIVYAPGSPRNATYNVEATTAGKASAAAKRLYRSATGTPKNKRVQVVSVKKESNPMSGIPRGKFIPVQAIRIGRNGKIDVKVSGATARKLSNPKGRKKRRNIAAGFYDEDGYFHPHPRVIRLLPRSCGG